MTLAERLAALGAAALGEATPDARLPKVSLRPVAAGMRLAGPARTVRSLPGDNLALHLAINSAKAGDVIVADCGGNTDSAPFREIMALACQIRGIAGLAINGAVHDSAQMAALGFHVFARGPNIRGTARLDESEIYTTLNMDGESISSGGMVVADADADLILPATSVIQALWQAQGM